MCVLDEINQKRIENEKNAAIIAEIQQQVAAMQDTFHKACEFSCFYGHIVFTFS